MNSTNTPETMENSNRSSKKLIIGGAIIAAALIILLGILNLTGILNWFGPGVKRLPDPPPIIIKTGSFTLESDTQIIQDSSSDVTFKRVFTGGIKGITIISYNHHAITKPLVELFEGMNSKWEVGDKVEIIIEVQPCQTVSSPQCTSLGLQQTIRIYTDNEGNILFLAPANTFLDSSNKGGKLIRQYRYDDKINQPLTTLSIRVNNLTRGIELIRFVTEPNQDSIVGIYNTLGNPTP